MLASATAGGRRSPSRDCPNARSRDHLRHLRTASLVKTLRARQDHARAPTPAARIRNSLSALAAGAAARDKKDQALWLQPPFRLNNFI